MSIFYNPIPDSHLYNFCLGFLTFTFLCRCLLNYHDLRFYVCICGCRYLSFLRISYWYWSCAFPEKNLSSTRSEAPSTDLTNLLLLLKDGMTVLSLSTSDMSGYLSQSLSSSVLLFLGSDCITLWFYLCCFHERMYISHVFLRLCLLPEGI